MSSTNNNGRKSTIVRDILIGIIVTVIGGIIVAYLIQDARFNPPETPTAPETETSDGPAPTLALYDTFDNSKYDGYINQALWEVNIEEGMTVNQNNGKLVFQASEPNDGGSL
jgi:hypothetical protein